MVRTRENGSPSGDATDTTPPPCHVSGILCRCLRWGGLIIPAVITILDRDLVLPNMALRVPEMILGEGDAGDAGCGVGGSRVPRDYEEMGEFCRLATFTFRASIIFGSR